MGLKLHDAQSYRAKTMGNGLLARCRVARQFLARTDALSPRNAVFFKIKGQIPPNPPYFLDEFAARSGQKRTYNRHKPCKVTRVSLNRHLYGCQIDGACSTRRFIPNTGRLNSDPPYLSLGGNIV